MINELRHRDPLLFWVGAAMLLTLLVVTLLSISDTRRAVNAVRWTISAAMIIEIACVILQAARGTTSHFNVATAFDALIFNIMGGTIAVNTLAIIVFLTLVRRDTPPSRAGYLWGIRLGLAMFLLASFEGGLIVANNAHTVGGPDGGAGLPFVNWSMEHGDLRIAHFFGMHAMQALPLIGFLSHSRNVVVGVGVIWLAVTGGLVTLALQGRPSLSL